MPDSATQVNPSDLTEYSVTVRVPDSTTEPSSDLDSRLEAAIASVERIVERQQDLLVRVHQADSES